MQIQDETKISINKLKVIKLTAFSIGFVVLGIWAPFHINPGNSIPGNIIVYGISALAVIFFGLCGAIYFTKLFNLKPGLILNYSGLTYNLSYPSFGLIPWSEVEGITTFQMGSQIFLVVILKNPEKYVYSGNRLKQFINGNNWVISKSPITITSNALKIEFGDLYNLVDQYFQKHKSATKKSPQIATLAKEL